MHTLTPEGAKFVNDLVADHDAQIRADEREQCAHCVPMNWCDELLSGKNAPKLPLDGPAVETLLRGIRDRIRGVVPIR